MPFLGPILQIAVPSPLRRLFDYLPPSNISIDQCRIGARVHVPFGARQVVGFIVGICHETTLERRQLKRVIDIIDDEALFPPNLWRLCHWVSEYYHYSLGEVLSMALPVLLRQGKIDISLHTTPPAPHDLLELLAAAPLTLNEAQEKVCAQIANAFDQFQAFLIDGVTGSGKTEVYLQVIAKALMQGKQALVLVPEIALTPQTIARFTERFSVACVALHSGLTERERLRAWQEAKAGVARIVIGTRSAIFTALNHLGIIVVDEEHDVSYKQQDRLRYHARDVAVYRAYLDKVPIILGSATPSLESFYNAERNRYIYLSLPQRAGSAMLPDIHLVDLRGERLECGLSPLLLKAIEKHLAEGNQVLLFLNRRGFVPALMCHLCGVCVECSRCDAYLTVHQQPLRLVCHHCGHTQQIPQQCEHCTKSVWIYVGVGTAKLEHFLAERFANFPITRIDRDTTRKKGALHQLLQSIQDGHAQILLGTQMLAKGHHFPHVTLVAILDADGGLFSSDFRALERMGQLLLQVAGRAGRAQKHGVVMIQTHHPQHPLLQTLLQEGYHAFLQKLLQERQQANLPPWTYLALIRAEALSSALPQEFLNNLREQLTAYESSTLQILGPISATIERVAGRYRAQLLVITQQRQTLQNFLTKALEILESNPRKRQVRWSVDVDPVEV